MAKYTEKQIAEMLATVDVETLNKVAEDRKLETLEPLIKEFEETDIKRDELISKIQAVKSDWKPASLGDKIITWMADNDEPKTKGEVQSQFAGCNVGLSLAGLVKKNRLNLKDGKYTINLAPAK